MDARPTSALAVPALHALQSERPCTSAYVPAVHATQPVAPVCGCTVPGPDAGKAGASTEALKATPHGRHAVDPFQKLNVPAAHAGHAFTPVARLLAVPGWHRSQEDWPVSAWLVPAGQGRQLERPVVLEKVPVLHEAHTDRPV